MYLVVVYLMLVYMLPAVDDLVVSYLVPAVDGCAVDVPGIPKHTLTFIAFRFLAWHMLASTKCFVVLEERLAPVTDVDSRL